MVEKKYWFYIDGYVHISMKGNELLLYNAYTKKLLEYNFDDRNAAAFRLVRRLLSPKAHRVVLLTTEDIKDESINRLIREIRGYYMGDLLDTDYSKCKPFQVPPRIKIQRDVRWLRNDASLIAGRNIMDNLSEITIFLNNDCLQSCVDCDKYYRQFLCCTSVKSSLSGQFLGSSILQKIIFEIQRCDLDYINISGGNIFLYPYLDSLEKLLNSIKCQKNFYLHYLNICQHLGHLELFRGMNKRLKLLVTFPLEEKKLKDTWIALSNMRIAVDPVFIIQNAQEYNCIVELSSEMPGITPAFLPFFSGDNIKFFEENVYINRNDIERNKLKLQNIYTNGVINSENFGKIFIRSDGRIHSNINAPSLGLVGKDSIRHCILKELESSSSWRNVRKNVMPCKACTFEKLCPPISNYSNAIGKYNLCHIKP